ncbi:MAG TPA: hypothetical protein VGN17_17870 [Bryobacteraceae bacterium]|jgi:hypothetical protein
MKKFLILWLSVIFAKYAVTGLIYSSAPAGMVTISYSKSSIALTVALIAMLVYTTVRSRRSAIQVRTQEVAAHPVAA